VPQVVNCHTFGGPNNLPEGIVYIGRPGPHGNPYSSKSGKYFREECIAYHRVDLYKSLIEDKSLFNKLKDELYNHDLGCWCKQPKRLVGCHGDNFLHIFSPDFINRSYDKSVVAYVMEDLRHALDLLRLTVKKQVWSSPFVNLDISEEEIRLELNVVIDIIKKRKLPSEDAARILATLAVECELASQEADPVYINYRIDRIFWVIHRFVDKRENRDGEPTSPHLKLKKKRSKD